MVQTLNARAWHFALARIGAALIAIALVGAPLAPAYAAGGLTGNLTGTVIDAQTSAPLAGATIDAVAPTGTYTATTNARGFFAILGMNVDTYTVSIQAQGFEPISVSGVTIPGDGNLSLGTVSAHKQLQTIGIVRARSQSSVFQPKQTIDSYTIAGARIIQTTGKAFATNQNNLVLAVPGVTLSNAGNPTIRGGLRTEVGYQLDGIPFTEPFFSQNASNGTFNGLGSLQVVEGAGDATQSDVGGGVVNIVPQRGTNPPFGAVDAEIGGPNFSHQFGINYGFATANGRISDYFSYIGQRNVPYLGQRGLATAAYNNFYGVSYNSSDDFLNNFVVKFGHDNNQSLQVLYENRRLDQYGNAGGIVNSGPFASSFYPNDPANPFNQNNPATGPFALQNYNNLVGLTPGLPQNLSAAVTGPELALFNPTRFLKFEYDYNVTPNTLLQARYYNWETLQGNQDLTGFTGNTPASLGLGSYPVWSQTGGQRTGAIVDITQQIGSRSTTTISGNYDDSHIVWDEFDPNAEVFELALSDLFGRAGPAYSDFLPGGYLSSFFPGGVPRIPVSGINYNGALFHSYGIGVREQYAATDRLKFDIGGRFDQQIQDYGYNPLNPTLPGNPSDVNPAGITPTYLEPHELQPRAAVSYQAGPNDAFRASYGRSIIFLNGQTAGTPAGFYNYQPFLNVPAKPGGFQCGSGVAGAPPVPCQNYAQQLYWLYDQNFDAPDLGAALPAIYSNYDFSYSHQFNNGFAFKVTPFYKLGVHLPSFALVTSLAAGAAVFTVNNEGINRTTGVEFGLTSPDRPYGLSGFLTATYQNVLGSTPPLVGGEDALPINGSGSLGLGDVYRAGYVSPFSTRIGFEYKMRNGLSIIPIIQYDRGYPFNIGNTIASSCLINGAFHNVQQVNFGCGVTQIPAYQAQTGTAASTNYYDPAYSGNTLNPNIAGTRGTPETASAGGALYKANVEANLTVQYKAGRSTFGVLISNLFGNQYNGVIPTINPYYQPVANGLSGPQTGANPYAPLYPNRGFANVPSNAYAFTNGAYLLIPNAPTSFQFYYQLGL